MEGKCCPTGAQYEPGEQVKKAKGKTVASSEGVVENVLGAKYKKGIKHNY